MKFSEINELTVKELLARRHEMRQEVFTLRLQQKSGQLERPHMLRAIRKDIARVQTAINKKQKEAAKQAA